MANEEFASFGDIRDVEIRRLQAEVTALKAKLYDAEKSAETIHALDRNDKMHFIRRCGELADTIKTLERELEARVKA